MSKPKFKVGDKVRVLDGSKIENYIGGWSVFMNPFVRDVFSISYVNKDYDGNAAGYKLKLMDSEISVPFIWDERGLELVDAKKQETIVIYRDGMKTVALDKRNGNKAVAKCCPDDEYDFGFGASLAFERLTGKTEQKSEPKLYSGKIFFVKGDEFWEAGKVYEIANCKTKNKNIPGGYFRFRETESFDEIRDFFEGKKTRIGTWSSSEKLEVMEVKED